MENSIIDVNEIQKIISWGGFFILDESVLNCTGFKQFFKNLATVIKENQNRFIVPSFIAEKLAPDSPARMVVDRNYFVTISANSYEDLYASLKASNNTKINILVNNGEARFKLVGIGKNSGVFSYFYSVDDEGQVLRVKGTSQTSTDKVRKPFVKTGEKKPEHHEKKGFTIKNVPERVPYQKINPTKNLIEGSLVYGIDNKRYRLVKKETDNNNAKTYGTDEHGVFIKIFEGGLLNTFTEAKITRMLSEKMSCDGLCWPIDIIKDETGVFRGYALNEYAGIPLHLCIFKRAGIDSYFSNWTKLDLIEVTKTILKKIEFLHKKNVLMGCINPASIRVVDKNTVYFTDTDDYQVDGFPTMVHNISFTAPELLDKKMYFATKANENFAVAELVFMMMMPGKTPYAVGTDEKPEELIKKMRFPYSTDANNWGRNPGMWRFMWSHLYKLKWNFYNIFQKDAKYNAPENRQGVGYWLNSLEYYKEDLLNSEDKESLKIYPQTFIREKGTQFYRCNYCGVEHPKFYFSKDSFDNYRICNGCINKRSDVSFECKACGKTYFYTNRMAIFHDKMFKQDSEWKKQKLCKDCKNKIRPCQKCGTPTVEFYLNNGMCKDCNNEVYETRYCKICYAPFDITLKQYYFYMDKHLNLPTKCENCRRNRY